MSTQVLTISRIAKTWSQLFEAGTYDWVRFRGRYRFVVSDRPEHSFVLECGENSRLLKDEKSQVDCEIVGKEEALVKLFRGVCSPQEACLQGELVVQGAMQSVLRWNVLMDFWITEREQWERMPGGV